MRDEVVARWADLLADYCLKVERDETIVISSAIEARPLVEACFKAVVMGAADTRLCGLSSRACTSSSSNTPVIAN